MPKPSLSENQLETLELIEVVFIEPAGRRRVLQVPVGQNLMEAALEAGVVGMGGQCGAAINCATCLCDIESLGKGDLPPQDPDEFELLQWVDEASTKSRLACQLIALEALSGIVLRVVPTT